MVNTRLRLDVYLRYSLRANDELLVSQPRVWDVSSELTGGGSAAWLTTGTVSSRSDAALSQGKSMFQKTSSRNAKDEKS